MVDCNQVIEEYCEYWGDDQKLIDLVMEKERKNQGTGFNPSVQPTEINSFYSGQSNSLKPDLKLLRMHQIQTYKTIVGLITKHAYITLTYVTMHTEFRNCFVCVCSSSLNLIMLTCPCIVGPRTPQFHIAKLRVYRGIHYCLIISKS